MRADVARDMGWSSSAFLGLVWPAIQHMCGGGELRPVEAVESPEMERHLDQLAGIDAWQICDGTGMRGIASRVQRDKSNKAWDTFTIRYSRPTGAETEWTKRLRAVANIREGWLFPHLTVQAYISADWSRVLSAAVVRTCDLWLHNPEKCAKEKRGCSINTKNPEHFLFSPWKHLTKSGVTVSVWSAEGARAA